MSTLGDSGPRAIGSQPRRQMQGSSTSWATWQPGPAPCAAARPRGHLLSHHTSTTLRPMWNAQPLWSLVNHRLTAVCMYVPLPLHCHVQVSDTTQWQHPAVLWPLSHPATPCMCISLGQQGAGPACTAVLSMQGEQPDCADLHHALGLIAKM